MSSTDASPAPCSIEEPVVSEPGGMAPRVALVTGGTAGIGAAVCEALLAAGYRVAANYAARHDAADAFATRTGIPVFPWNVADLAACAAGVGRVQAALGPIEILVNNAGITRDAMLHKMSAEQWREVIDVDLGGCFNMCRSVIEGMRERRFGRIVNVSSVNALSGQAGQTNYAAAKAGMIGLTKSLALEGAARNITVNAIAPGYTDTAMVGAVAPQVLEQILKSVPAGRLATPAEVARGVVFLAADDAGFVNGITLSINGAKYLS
jgi:acetoacetyl-CoA reductase